MRPGTRAAGRRRPVERGAARSAGAAAILDDSNTPSKSRPGLALRPAPGLQSHFLTQLRTGPVRPRRPRPEDVMPTYVQADRPLSVVTPLGKDALLAVGLSGR